MNQSDSSRYLQERGARRDAARLLEAALSVSKRGLRADPNVSDRPSDTSTLSPTSDPLRALQKLLGDISNSLGTLELSSSRFDKALEYMLDAILKRTELGIVDEELIYTKRNAGVALLSLNRVDEAYRAFQESMSLREQQLEESSDRERLRDNLASNFGSLSYALLAKGRLDEAWDAATKSTELCKQVHRPESKIMAELV